jgi:hypothetical protein
MSLGAIDSAIGPLELFALDAGHFTAEVEAFGGAAL